LNTAFLFVLSLLWTTQHRQCKVSFRSRDKLTARQQHIRNVLSDSASQEALQHSLTENETQAIAEKPRDAFVVVQCAITWLTPLTTSLSIYVTTLNLVVLRQMVTWAHVRQNPQNPPRTGRVSPLTNVRVQESRTCTSAVPPTSI